MWFTGAESEARLRVNKLLYLYVLYAAVDVTAAPHGAARDHATIAGDREERKQQDYDDLVDTALQKTGSKKALVPSKSKKKLQQVDLNKLTRSKRQLVVEQALQVFGFSQPAVLHTLAGYNYCPLSAPLLKNCITATSCVALRFSLLDLCNQMNQMPVMQSKDADPERFFRKLKERMQRWACFLDVTTTAAYCLQQGHEDASTVVYTSAPACAGLKLTSPVWRSDFKTSPLMLTLLLAQEESLQC